MTSQGSGTCASHFIPPNPRYQRGNLSGKVVRDRSLEGLEKVSSGHGKTSTLITLTAAVVAYMRSTSQHPGEQLVSLYFQLRSHGQLMVSMEQ